jgi:hypothetical protein
VLAEGQKMFSFRNTCGSHNTAMLPRWEVITGYRVNVFQPRAVLTLIVVNKPAEAAETADMPSELLRQPKQTFLQFRYDLPVQPQ